MTSLIKNIIHISNQRPKDVFLMCKYISPIIVFEQNGQDYVISWQTSALPQSLAYEIEDEAGRIINGTADTKKDFTLPKLGVGYYHLRLRAENIDTDSLIIIAPTKAYVASAIITPQSPINSLKNLRQVLQEKSDLHYQFPFPRFADLAAVYRRHLSFAIPSEPDNEQALFLALKSRHKINQNFQDWCNRCYDFNKINSYKCKEFAKENQAAINQAASILAEVDTYLQKSKAYLHRQGRKVIAYVSNLTAADYQSFEGWQNRKLLKNKLCVADKNFVPYDSQSLKENFYRPIIAKVRAAMQGSDVLYIADFAGLEKNLCTDFPFPDKEETYASQALLAILKIESRRHRCAIMATTSSKLSAEFLAQCQASGIIFCVPE